MDFQGKRAVVGADGVVSAVDLTQDDLDQLAADEAANAVNLVDYARMKSWRIRTGGTVVNGIPVRTDSESLALISGMAMLAQLDPTRTFSFDTEQGTVPLTSAQALAFASAVGSWVQGTFDKRAAALAGIASGTITTTGQVDAALA